ncbi:dihydrofolate reductase family protein [Micromonospora soli]|uniref:dihydrofolate reductase family protein n=1 Tax=Micromonospora sp. NBRC 110009 TaxID=3061627 RepID=UPI002671ADC1|nr:dihydrofolate reductase family protein [Micromonospora sp. NBRC 110009]WKT97620.1 dihydrofolate reductase family protein [Micromonospora sp. NBRC 110009]
MGTVVLYKSMSLDGFVAGPDIGAEHPMGKGGMRLHEWMFTDRPDPRDKEVIAATFASVGAVVVGKRTFDVGLPHWEDTPYPAPTFVLTHQARDELAMKSATFTFVTDGIETALKSAQDAAEDKDVIVMGAQTGRQFLRAGLLDEMQINLVPVVLGAGTRLLDDLGHIELERTQVIASDAVTHLRFRVVK